MPLEMSHHLDSASLTTWSEMLHLHDAGELWLDPPFQRASVWTVEQQVCWIESLLDGLPLPALFLNYADDDLPGDYGIRVVVIDGRQRLEAMMAFRADAFRVRGELWSEQDRLFQRRFERTSVPVVRTRFNTEREMIELYTRLLTTGTAHTPDEIEKARAMLAGMKDAAS